jgi:hypothetical protein
MKRLIGLLIATTLVIGSGCAKEDWIDRTLVTVDVTGTWSGALMAAGTYGTGGTRDVVFELEQQGSTVKGSMRVAPRGAASSDIEGTVAGDVFRFKDARDTWQGTLTVSGDEMEGPAMTGGLRGQLTLRRVDPSSRPASPPR